MAAKQKPMAGTSFRAVKEAQCRVTSKRRTLLSQTLRNLVVFLIGMPTAELSRYICFQGKYLHTFVGITLMYIVAITLSYLPLYERIGGVHRKDLGVWDSLKQVAWQTFQFLTMQTIIVTNLRHYVHPEEKSFIEDYFYFLAISFLYEFAFDIYFYWFHRMCHTHKWLYEFSHSHHHKHTYVNPLLTFDMDTFELVTTQALPGLVFFYYAAPLVNARQIWWLMFYKLYLEVAGHAGYAAGYGSFTQAIFPIADVLGITLVCEDHDMHHTHYKVNYGKRFNVCDRLFGSYVQQLEFYGKKVKKKVEDASAPIAATS